MASTKETGRTSDHLLPPQRLQWQHKKMINFMDKQSEPIMNWSNQQLIAVNKVLPRYLLNFWRHKSATAVEDNFMGRLFNEKYWKTNHAPKKHRISLNWFYRQPFHNLPTTATFTRTSLRLTYAWSQENENLLKKEEK